MPSIFSLGTNTKAHPVIKASNGRQPTGSHPFTGLSSGNTPRAAFGTPFVAATNQRQSLGAHGTQSSPNR
jgi:hypothetical protein